jgi:nicotinamidase-related amidase
VYGIQQDVIDRVMARRGRLHAYERFDAAKTALVVVDLQNYFMAPGSPAEVPVARDIVPAVNKAADAVRTAGGTVAWVGTTSRGADVFWSHRHKELMSPEASSRQLELLDPDSDGFRLWDGLAAAPEDLRITKRFYSAMSQGSSDLETELRGRGIDTILIAGTVTNVCCESTGRDAMMLDFRTVMLADANAAKSRDAHVAALAGFLETFGDVMSVEEMIERLAPVPAPSPAGRVEDEAVRTPAAAG